ncbi:DNA-binding protein [Pseudomonas corrugata]|uniref:DNA-binding protein n=1 Tax=Pseudomonas corrugata TaxID=47879 RepID=UPI0028C5005B|nr:DNA-binding protein [Pseudomonas corrugata]MDU9034280.1 DNA-binding protein [Pseudomonas corrugata]
MARTGINKALVQQARDALLARQERPSIEAVRAELGHTGSKSTIQRYLKELAEQQPIPPEIKLSDELQAYIASLAQRLAHEAQQSVIADRARLQRQQAIYEHQRQVEAARQDELTKNHQRLLEQHQSAQEHNRHLAERLQTVEGERQRLLASTSHQEALLNERAQQIGSLEEKHQHAREALRHYRDHAQQQRVEETQRYETQLQGFQHELRECRQQLLSKQEELGQLYRDLERVTLDQQHRSKDLRSQAHEIEQWSRRYQNLQSDLHQAQARSASQESQLSTLHERARHYLLDRRQDQRNLRQMMRQINQLQSLLSTPSHNQESSTGSAGETTLT